MKKILICGSINVDMTIGLDHSPLPGETVTANRLEYNSGGKGANQACAVGKLSALKPSFFASIGNDTFKDKIFKQLDMCGVDRSNINVIKNVPTGIAVVSIDKNGENSIIVCPNANQYTNSKYFHSLENNINEYSYMILQNEIPLETNLYLMRLASKAGVKVIYNPAPALDNFPISCFKYVDYLTPNQTELSSLISKRGSIAFKAHELLKLGVKNVIVTLGKNGSYYTNIDESFTVDGFKVNAVDTVAAGDTFNGALAVALNNNLEIKEALKFASAASALTVTKKGAISSIPSLVEVEDFLKQTNEVN